MYCPSCGSELTSELTYCNRCGVNLKPLLNQSGPPVRIVGATWAISMAVVFVTLGGFSAIGRLVLAIINNGVNLSGGGILLLGFGLLIILAIASLLIRQLSRVLDLAQLSGGATQSKQPHQPRLSEKPVRQIEAPREPVASVTEHTTRMFEPIPRDRDTQR
jgi:hypothetical protein